jgi:hypothetical protein
VTDPARDHADLPAVAPIAYPWERQEGESTKSWAAFQLYRDLPPMERSIQRAYSDQTGKTNRAQSTQSHWRVWSSRWRWVERAAAWDDEQDRKKREERQDEIRKMAERQARQAEQMAAALMQPAMALLRKLQQEQQRIQAALAADPTAADSPENQPELLRESMAALVKMTAECARAVPQLVLVERQARGLSTEHIAVELRPTSRTDPIQTQDEYALSLWEAMIEAGLLPEPEVT